LSNGSADRQDHAYKREDVSKTTERRPCFAAGIVDSGVYMSPLPF